MKRNWSDNFESLYKERGQQRHGLRLLAMWKMQSGMTAKDVGNFIGKTERTIGKWQKAYNKGGLECLLDIAKGRGRKSKCPLSDDMKQKIQALSENRSYGRIKCSDAVWLIEEEYNVKYSEANMYKILHKLGFAWISSRSVHPKQIVEKQEEFKKNSGKMSDL